MVDIYAYKRRIKRDQNKYHKREEKLEKKCNDSPNRYSHLREKKILWKVKLRCLPRKVEKTIV
jgi:hypothetical protein